MDWHGTGNKQLPEPMMTKVQDPTWLYFAIMEQLLAEKISKLAFRGKKGASIVLRDSYYGKASHDNYHHGPIMAENWIECH